MSTTFILDLDKIWADSIATAKEKNEELTAHAIELLDRAAPIAAKTTAKLLAGETDPVMEAGLVNIARQLNSAGAAAAWSTAQEIAGNALAAAGNAALEGLKRIAVLAVVA